MSRNIYSQTSPLEALTMLGQGLKQGVGDVMQQMAEQRQQQGEMNMIGQALAKLSSKTDRESVLFEGMNYMRKMGEMGMSGRGMNDFLNIIYRQAAVTPSKADIATQKHEETMRPLEEQKAGLELGVAALKFGKEVQPPKGLTKDRQARWDDLLTRYQNSKTAGYAEFILGVMQDEFPDMTLPNPVENSNIPAGGGGTKIGIPSFKDFTAESLQEYEKTGDETVLVKITEKPSLGVPSFDDFTVESIKQYQETNDPAVLERIPSDEKYVVVGGNYKEPAEVRTDIKEAKESITKLERQIKAAKSKDATKEMKAGLPEMESELSSLQKTIDIENVALNVFRWWKTLSKEDKDTANEAMASNPKITKEMLWRKYGTTSNR